MTKPLNIGMVGCGFMGRAHSNAYHRVNQFFDLAYQPVLKALAESTKERAEEFARRWGWQRVESDWRKLVEASDIDLIDICSPNNTHHAIALAAAAAGKMILCEKPLAMNLKEAREMTHAVEKSGNPNMVSFNYRRVPAISLAKRIIEEGRLGQNFPLSRDVPSRLDHLAQRACGRAGHLAPRQRCSWDGSLGRPLSSQYRYRRLAKRPRGSGLRDDRGVH
jgi:predicted dehydrogenase